MAWPRGKEMRSLFSYDVWNHPKSARSKRLKGLRCQDASMVRDIEIDARQSVPVYNLVKFLVCDSSRRQVDAWLRESRPGPLQECLEQDDKRTYVLRSRANFFKGNNSFMKT
jgi:hypothetical protein